MKNSTIIGIITAVLLAVFGFGYYVSPGDTFSQKVSYMKGSPDLTEIKANANKKANDWKKKYEESKFSLKKENENLKLKADQLIKSEAEVTKLKAESEAKELELNNQIHALNEKHDAEFAVLREMSEAQETTSFNETSALKKKLESAKQKSEELQDSFAKEMVRINEIYHTKLNSLTQESVEWKQKYSEVTSSMSAKLEKLTLKAKEETSKLVNQLNEYRESKTESIDIIAEPIENVETQ